MNSNIIAISIVEPSITNLVKTANPTAGDAGDTISYRITFSNPATANVTTAFDLRLLDALPAKLASTLGASRLRSAGQPVSSTCQPETASTSQIGSLVPGGTIQVDYDAVLLGSVQPEELLPTQLT